MTETRQTVFRQTKEEFEQLKNDAYEHKMNISDYLRYLVAKERKETSEIERIRNIPSRECISREQIEKYILVEKRKEKSNGLDRK